MYKRLLAFLAMMVVSPAFAEDTPVIALQPSQETADCTSGPSGTLQLGNDPVVHQTGTYGLTAVWEPNTIKLRWDNGGHGVAPSTPISCTYGESFTTASAIDNDGQYVFQNWYVHGNDLAPSTSVICDADNLGVSEDNDTATLTAVWQHTDCEEGYYLASRGGGCVSCPVAYPRSERGSTAITDCYTQRNPSCEPVTAVRTPAHCEIQWENSCSCSSEDLARTYTVYSNESGTGDGRISGSTKVNCDLSFEIIGADEGYYVDSQTQRCLPNTYYIKYTCGAGTGEAPSGGSVKFGDSYRMAPIPEECEKTGYKFKNWSCGPVKVTTNADSVTMGARYLINRWNYTYDLICDATWESVDYTVSYDCDIKGVSTVTDTAKHRFGDQINVASAFDTYCHQDKQGYDFNGWDCAESGTNTFRMPDKDVLCKAQWEPKTYNIVYKPGDHGEGENITKTVKYNAYVYEDGSDLKTLKATTFTATTGYKFKDWASDHTVNNGAQNDTIYRSEYYITPYKVLGDTEMVAEWELDKYNITYKIVTDIARTDNIKLPSQNPAEYTIETATKQLLVPTSNEYIFGENWYECDSGDIVREIPGGYAKDLNLCIDMEEEEYNITYIGCINGDCNNSIELNGYVTNPSKLTYSNSRRIEYPKNTVATGIELDIDRLNSDKSPEGPYNFDNQWYKNSALTDYTYGVLSTQRYDLTIYTNLKTYFHVTYDCGEDATGTVPTDTKKYTYDDNTVKVKQNTCKKQDYDFVDWTCDGRNYNPDNSFEITGNITCIANWTPSKYHLTLDCNTSESVPSVVDLEAETSVVFAENSVSVGEDYTLSCENQGYDFVGWNCDKQIDITNFKMPSYDVNCAANWEPQEYNIIYKAGSIDGVVVNATPQEKSVRYGESKYVDNSDLKTLSFDTFMVPGYEVYEWLSSHNVTNGASESTSYSENTAIKPYKVLGDTEMIAQWRLNSYKVKYFVLDPEKHEDTTTGNPTTYNVEDDIELVLPTKVGYENVSEYWYLCNDKVGSVVKADAASKEEVISLSGGFATDLNLCFDMKQEIYPIKYIGCKNGECDNSIELNPYIDENKQTYTISTPTVFPQTEAEVRIEGHYIFNGVWYMSNDLSGNRKTATEIGETGALTVYTNIKPYFNVDYDCGEDATGTVPTDTKKYTYDNNTVKIKQNTCKKQDYDFVDWTCDGNNYNSNDSFVITADTTCTANWNPIKYFVKYNCNLSDTISLQFVDDNKYAKNTEVTVLGEEQCGNHVGYEFVEWKCDNDIGAKSKDGTFVMPGGDVICTGNWKPKKYNVNYYCDAEAMTSLQNAVTTDSVEFKQVYTLQGSSVLDNNCSKPGYVFDKQWVCVVNNNSKNYKAQSRFTWKNTEDMNCYAGWSLKPYRITYKVVSESNVAIDLPSQNPSQYTIDDVTKTLVLPTKDEYIFGENWYECDSGDIVREIPGGYAKDLNLCIDMEEEEYNITYIGCINGDCNNSIELNGYVTNPSKLTYSNSRRIEYPKNTVATGIELDIDRLNSDKSPEGPYNFDNQWYKNSALTDYTYGVLSTQRYDLTIYTNLKTYFHVTYDCDGGTRTPQDETSYINGSKVKTFDGETCGDKQGYHFDKWMCGGNLVNANDRFTIISDTTCVALWDKNTYHVTYDCNGGKKVGSTESDSINYSEEYTFAKYADACTNKGYTFVDWKCSEAKNLSNNNVYNQNDVQDTIVWNFVDDLICTAELNKEEYDITYLRNVDNTDDETISGLTPDKYSVTDRVVLPTVLDSNINIGHTFKGWLTNRNINTTTSGWFAGQRTGDVEVYAKWEPNNYVIKYLGGTAGTRNVTAIAMSDQNVTYGDKNIQLKTNTYAVTGYEFTGWECVATDSQNVVQTVSYNDNEPYVIDSYNYLSDMECEAQWKPRTYDITYEVGNCAGQKYNDSDALTYDATYSLRMPCNTTVNAQPGYEFKGWRTRNSVKPDHHAGTTYGPWTQNKGLTLYGVCERVPYNVTYDCDSTDSDSVTPQDSNKHYFGDNVSTVTGTANTCKKLGSTFDVWECRGSEHSNITWTRNGGDGFEMPDENVVCKAKWNQNRYKVTYDCNGGTNAPEDNSDGYTYNQFVNTLQNTCVKTGYDFTKWVCAGEDVVQTEGFNIFDDTTCFADWMPKKYDIIYNNGTCGGGTYTEHSLEFNNNFDIRDRSYPDMNVSVPKGYEFLGWSTNVQAAEVDYKPNKQYGPWTTDSDLDLYAVCKIREYTITYNHNGGAFENGVNALSAYTVNTPDEIVPASFRNGYVFQGWFEDAGFQGNEIVSVPDLFKDNPHDVTLYAKWIKAGKITFVCPADFSATSDLTIDVDSVVGETINAKNDDDCEISKCTIEKWQCGNNNREYTVNEPIAVVDGTLTCRAVISCANQPYQITYRVFAVNEFTGETTEIDTVYENDQETLVENLTPKTYTTGVSVTYPEISLPDHEFIGWFNNERFTGKTVTGTPVKPANQQGENIIVYGKMLYNAVYTITYHNDEGSTYAEGAINPTMYTAATPVFVLNVPAKDGYRFKGWHLDSENGQVISEISGELRRDLDLYAEWEFACNEEGFEHWLHIGEGENDKICLYETRPSGSSPVIKIKKNDGDGYYYAILSSNENTTIHKGSTKKLHVRRGKKTYNVCDRSSCP